MRTGAPVLALLVAACSGSAAPGASSPPRSDGPAARAGVAALHSAQPSVIDDATLARMIAGPTDWASFVSPTRGVVALEGDYIDRHCGPAAATKLAAAVAAMRGATCESSTEQALCETKNPTRIVQFIHEEGRWFGYGITDDEPNDLPRREIAVFDPIHGPRTCEPMHRELWNSYALDEEDTRKARWERLRRERHASETRAAPPPAPDPAPTAARFEAAPNILGTEPTLGCTAKHVDGYLQLRCPLAGAGRGLLDIGNRQGGRYDVTATHVTWTVRRDAMTAFSWWFDRGAFELASSSTRAQWVEAATYRPGAAAILRAGMTCCIAKHSAQACVGRGVLEAVAGCRQHKSDCAAMDACIRKTGKLDATP